MPDEEVTLRFSAIQEGTRDEAKERARRVQRHQSAHQRELREFPFSLRKSMISFMPFPFIHQPGPA